MDCPFGRNEESGLHVAIALEDDTTLFPAAENDVAGDQVTFPLSSDLPITENEEDGLHITFCLFVSLPTTEKEDDGVHVAFCLFDALPIAENEAEGDHVAIAKDEPEAAIIVRTINPLAPVPPVLFVP